MVVSWVVLGACVVLVDVHGQWVVLWVAATQLLY